MDALHLDFETRSAVDLKRVGVHRYAEDPSTSVICLSYRIGEGPVESWRRGEELPDELLEHVGAGGLVRAHNAAFERTIWRHFVSPNLPLRPEQQDCTLARGAALGLPQSLDQLAVVLNAPAKKDMVGHKLMLKMCRPRRKLDDGTFDWWESPEEIQRLSDYCDQDVWSECGVDGLLPLLSPTERRAWILDQNINDRGFAVDLPLVRRAIAAVEEATRRADRAMWLATGGAVRKCTEAAKLVAWINSQGIPCESVRKGDLEELITGAKTAGRQDVETAIELRRAGAKSSTAKYRRIEAAVCSDGRLRGQIAYHAAHTGRWGGRVVQPQNFPRLESLDSDFKAADVAKVVTLLEGGMATEQVVDSLELLFGKPLDALSKSLRTMIVAAPGKMLRGGDWSNIEGRLNAWFAGEHWKLRAFEAYDRGEGPDLYKVTAARILAKPIELVVGVERQAQGKIPELAQGYEGSVGAYVTMAATYGINPADVAAVAKANCTEAEWIRAKLSYDPARGYGLPEDVWIGIKVVVNAWRDANPAIVASWREVEDAAIEAVAAPGMVVPCLGGKVHYMHNSGYLWCQLPSGRVIAYPSAHIRWANTPFLNADGTPRKKRQIVYLGVDSTTKQWGRQSLYGGSQINHIVQGSARDVLLEAMFRLEANNYPIVLTIHDEIVSEADEGFGSLTEFTALMEMKPAWCAQAPLTVSAWEGRRYGK